MIAKSKPLLHTSAGCAFITLLAMQPASAEISASAETPASTATAEAASSTNQHPGANSAADEIVVTANKREESINKVGLTIKALGADQLQQQRVTTLADLAAAVPGLNYAQTENGTPVYTLRGIGFYDTAIGAAPAVSVYLDQAPLAYPVMTTLTLFDIQRVEVLKGPQGTLFGSNATGGAINYIAAKPTRDPEAGVSLTYGRFNTFSTDAYISGPITDKLLGRIAVNATDGGGWQRSISRPDDANGAPNSFAGRFLLDWRPTERLRIQTNLNGWRDRTQPSAAQFVAFIPTFADFIPNPLPNPFIPNATKNPRLAEWSPESSPRANNRLLQATVRVDYDVTDKIILTSLTDYAGYKQSSTPEGDGLVQQRNDLRDFDGRVHSFSQEVRLADNDDPRFRWTIGANYSRNINFDSFNDWYKDNTAAHSPSNPPFFGAVGIPGGWSTNGASVHQVAKDYAGFASAEYTIGRFTLKGGARYTQDNRHASNCTFALVDDGQTSNPLNTFFAGFASFLSGTSVTVHPGDCLTIGANGLPHAVPGKLNEHNVSWRAGVDWKPSDTLLLYMNVSKGYKAGGFGNFGGGTDTSYEPVTQESVLTYEGGVKAQLFDRKMSLTAAGFYSDYTDKQIKSKLFDPIFGYLEALVNVPKSRITGFEADTTIRPIRGLSLGGAVTYLDTKIKDATGPDGKPLITLVNLQTNSVGNPIPYASKWTLTGNFNYSFKIGDSSDAFLGVQVMHRTKTNASIGDEPVVDIPGYTTVDLQAGVDLRNGKYRIMVWGKNITNEFYATNRSFTFDGVGQFVGMPATYGVTLSAKF